MVTAEVTVAQTQRAAHCPVSRWTCARMRLPMDLKLVGKKEQSYASLDVSDTSVRHSSAHRLNAVPLSPSAVSTMSLSSDDSAHTPFHSEGRGDAILIGETSGQPLHRTVANDVLAALDGPIRQLAFETKGALLATGYVERWRFQTRVTELVHGLTD